MNKMKNLCWTQRQATSLDVIKMLASHSTEKARHSSSTAFFASETETETDDEPRSVREGSITTDDSVRCQYD